MCHEEYEQTTMIQSRGDIVPIHEDGYERPPGEDIFKLTYVSTI